MFLVKNDPVESFLLFLMSAFELVTLLLEEDFIGPKVGLNLSPKDVFLILSNVGTEPFLGNGTCVENAGWLALRGINLSLSLSLLTYSVLSESLL